MFRRLGSGWVITKQSLQVLGSHKWLLVFPLLTLLVVGGFFAGVVAGAIDVGLRTHILAPGDLSDVVDEAASVAATPATPSTATAPASETRGQQPNDEAAEATIVQTVAFVAFLVVYFCIYSISTFFNVALLACVLRIFRGEEAGFGYGIGVAVRRLPAILGWSLIVTTVGILLSIIESRGPAITRFVSMFAGLAWAVATFFVLPVIIAENAGPIRSVRRSTSLLRDVWGEFLVVNIGIRGIVGICMFVLGGTMMLVMAYAGAETTLIVPPILGAALFVMLLILAPLSMIAHAALYHYATENNAPPPYTEAALRQAIAPRLR
ncbi:MAG: DUF6159 family protein [Pseudomonadota bacterium]